MERYSRFIKNNHKKVILIWLLVAIILSPFAPMINNIIVYNIEVTLPNSEFQITVDKLYLEFQKKNYTEPYLTALTVNNYYILIKSDNPYSKDIKMFDIYIREKFENKTHKYTLSYYKLIKILLYNLIANYSDEINLLYKNSFIIYNTSIIIRQNLAYAIEQYNILHNFTKEILYFLYGSPSIFLKYYMSIIGLDFYTRSEIAKQMTIKTLNLSDFTLEYFISFYKYWIEYKPFIYVEGAQSIINQIGPIYLQKYFNISQNITSHIFLYSNLRNWNSEETSKNITFNILVEIFKNNTISNEIFIAELKNIINNKESIDEATYNIIYRSLIESIQINNTSNIISDYIKGIISKKVYNETIARKFLSQLVSDMIVSYAKYNPYFTIDNNNLSKFIEKIILNNDIIHEIDSWIINKEIEEYPIKLRTNIESSFIDKRNGIFMIVVYSNHTITDSEIVNDLKVFDEIKSVSSQYNVQVYITGVSLLSHELKVGAENALFTVIPLGLFLVFLLVTLYFRSIVAGALVIAHFALSIIVAFAIGYIILGLWLKREISFISPSIVVVLTLGLCSDYVVYLLKRYKTEREEGKNKEEAIFFTTFWSSRGVLTSALAVLFSYVILSLMNIPLFGDAAIANTIAVTSTLITSVLFFPSLLYIFGDKVLWPYRKLNRKTSRLSKIYDINIKKHKEITLLLTAITLISLLFVANINTVLDVPPLMPESDVQKGSLLLYSTLGSYMSPIYIYIEGKNDVLIGDEINLAYLNYVQEVSDKIAENKHVKYVYTIDRPFGEKIDLEIIYSNETLKSIYLPLIKRFVGASNKSVLIQVIIDKQPFSLEAIEVLKDIRSKLPRNNEFNLLVDGVTQLSYDSKLVTDSATPTIIISLITVIAILLFLQLISVLIPLRLIATVLCSVSWSLALLYITYNQILNLPIINAVPIFLAVTMLGVGVDYDIFLLTRVREEVVKGKKDEEAIKISLEKTGSTIMFLGLLLGGTFLLLFVPRFPLLNEIGFTLGLSVIFDAFIIVQFFVPSIMLLAKRWNWWPSKLSRRG